MENSIKGMMLLVTGIVFVSCGQTDVFEQNQNALIDQQKNEYRTNYVQKYGEVPANQSWDFSGLSSSQAKTRGLKEFFEQQQLIKLYHDWLEIDFASVQSKIKTAEVKEWNPYLKVEMFPAYLHVPKGFGFGSYNLALCNNGEIEDLYTQRFLDRIIFDKWYLLERHEMVIDTKSLTTANNFYWAAYPKEYGLFSTTIPGSIEDYKITNYKEVKVNGRTYWGFNCNKEGDYTDFVCMVNDIDPIKPIEKRYLIEDLGSKDDFDFNDIVVDVKQDLQGNQKAIIRAMGGILDFTIKIGNTEWTKSVDGVAAGCKTSTMYNTQGNVEWDKALVEFPVTGWNPNTNNISVSVKSIVNDNVIITIPFPKVGEVPMIIAVETKGAWQKERVSLPDDWWTIPEEVTELGGE